MIAQLSDLSQAAQPTSFHCLLRALDNRGRLLRVYTQNIDAIEQKSGLSFGVPGFEGKRYKSRPKQKLNVTDQPYPIASTSRLPSPPPETPRCIPLHGTLQTMHCQICNHSFPLLQYLPSLISGQPPSCPECTSLESTRQLVGKRPRGIGKLRPNVVLYNEAHKDGEGVGEVVQKDLLGSSKGKGRSGADLLLVVGTSLKIPGTKRMVREFAKAVRARGPSSPPTVKDESSSLPIPTSSPRRSPTADEEPIPKAVYLNLDFPVPTREWEGVFDAWIQGDAQLFSKMLHAEIEKEAKAKEVAVEKKRKRDLEAAVVALTDDELPDLARAQQEKAKNKSGATKRKLDVSLESSVKRRKASRPISPPNTPPSIQRNIIVHHRERLGESQSKDKFYLRIPPLSGLKPEVYITSRPSYSISTRTVESSVSDPSISADVQPNKHAKAGSRAVREARHKEIKALQWTTPP